MNPPDLSTELQFRTARSGGKGGQNVNKVETMVEAIWQPSQSLLFSEEDKLRIIQKLAAKINKAGELLVRASEHRSQLENKLLAQQKLELLVGKSLIKPKPRKASKPSKAAIQRRLDDKKMAAKKKENRRNSW
ncbi:MAG: aminoacyl-tRNA hydrolase [Bacteroidetes bacterium]|nr:aminoacyl-tRNA hydrolase [Bacteroidota bacterium]